MGYLTNNYNSVTHVITICLPDSYTHYALGHSLLQRRYSGVHRSSQASNTLSSHGSGPERHVYIHTYISVLANTPYLAGGSGFL